MSFPFQIDQIKIRENLAIGRKLAGFTQVEAAKKLGYVNSGALSKIENIHGKYAKTPISFNLAYNCSQIYGLSLDFIGTRTANPDFGSREGHEAALFRGLQYTMQEETRKRLKGLLVAGETFKFMDELLVSITMINKVHTALKKFKQLNPSFENEQRGSATLDSAINKAFGWSSEMSKKIRRMSKAKHVASIIEKGGRCSLYDETIDGILGDEKMQNDNEQERLWGLS